MDQGIEEGRVEEETNRIFSSVGLLPYANVCAGVYSGGNKRKLSLAIALVRNDGWGNG